MEAPVFVKISEYKDLTAILEKIQSRIEATDKLLEQLDTIKEEEDQRIQEWKESLELVKTKVENVGGALHQE